MSPVRRRLPVGAEVQPDGTTHFRVWAPAPRAVRLLIEEAEGATREVALEAEPGGYYAVLVAGVGAGRRYKYSLDGQAFPDPASRSQPDGPFGPSEVVDPARYAWRDGAWKGVSLRGQVLYEMHVGTFTAEGTWRAAMERLRSLADIGITTVEVMPLSEFPGRFGWGYDGVLPYAPTRLYGSPDDFRAFVDCAHEIGLGVILDVVYNHIGPDGSVFRNYAPSYYSTNKDYINEWGDPLNFDGQDAVPSREFWSSNAAYWIDEFHLDGLRLDATQSIHDFSERHIIAEISAKARAAAPGRDIILVSENEPQHVRMVRPLEQGGYGLDALWNDDFHHSAVVAMTGRNEAYLSDHRGAPQEFISAAKYGYLFQGQRYAWQKNPRGTRTDGVPPAGFVNFTENHDQVANLGGDGSRLWQKTTPGRYRAMTALVLLMPGTPMLFQGQEFGSSAPFLYFADHKGELAEAVRRGRAEFVRQFPSLASPAIQAKLPPPDDPATFEKCKLDWRERETHTTHVRLHSDLIALRRRDPAFSAQAPAMVDGAVLGPETFVLRYFAPDAPDERLLIVNFGPDLTAGGFPEPLVAPPDGFTWSMAWTSEHPDYGGGGTPEVATKDGWRIPGHSATVLAPAPRRSTHSHGDLDAGSRSN